MSYLRLAEQGLETVGPRIFVPEPLDRLPVIVGVGQVNDRPDDPLEGMNPVALMVEALRRAEADSGARMLTEADTLATVKQISFPDVADCPDRVAGAIGALHARLSETVLPSGESPVRLLNDAANRIGTGEIEVALVCGGEALRTAAAHVAASEKGRKLDPVREARHRVHTGYAAEHGLIAPVDFYPLYENALRASLGQTFDEAQAESSVIWSLMSQVAASNPHAWIHKEMSPAEIAAPSPSNRMIAFPYTKLQVANSSVNQGAASIVTSVGKARSLAIPRAQWIYVGNGAGANEPEDVLARDRLDRSVSMEAVIRRALDLNGIEPGDLDAVELYSCFPCIPKLARRVLGWPVEKPASVFGGLTFGGGPVGNYMSHAIASMTDRLRARGGTGLLFGNGGVATRNHAIVLSSDPIEGASFPRSFGFQDEADALRGPIPSLDENHIGPATVETWTVFFERNGSPCSGVVVARTPNGARTLALLKIEDCAALTSDPDRAPEPIGSMGQIVAEGDRRFWQFH
ncbi:MAG: acetyl-CoA acetyltransferase [Novosphingobium sp.]|nr:acetyl-CoA acetyltransferase [Novosphingobium sp.]